MRNLSCPRIVIAAPKSGSGKTTVTCALLSALKNRGLAVCSFKCGPDYIDPMYHRSVIGIPSGNLDLFFTGEAETASIFASECAGDIAVIEGVMGLYDGLGGIREEASTYHLARTLRTPILLVVDAHGAGRSLLAEIRGFLDYDSEGLIRGVILNRTSSEFAKRIAPGIEQETGIPVIGSMPVRGKESVASRHLGLILPEEIPELRERLRQDAEALEQHTDIDRILAIAREAPRLHVPDVPDAILREPQINESSEQWNCIDTFAGARSDDPQTDDDSWSDKLAKCAGGNNSVRGSNRADTEPVRIAVARDEAFCFYYRENMEMLERYGLKMVYFSPLRDAALPENIGGLIIGGGYPELHLPELSGNDRMKQSIRNAAEEGMPILAECGGFMYLGKAICGRDGRAWPMAGVHTAVSRWNGHLTRFGYVTIRSGRGGWTARGHEFHYYDSDDNGSDCTAVKPVTGRTWNCIHESGNRVMGFPHLYYPSCPELVHQFADRCKSWGNHSKQSN